MQLLKGGLVTPIWLRVGVLGRLGVQAFGWNARSTVPGFGFREPAELDANDWLSMRSVDTHEVGRQLKS